MGRIYSLDGMKFITAFLVVCIHKHLPGTLGQIVLALARTAVPFYFMTSGFFLWHENDKILTNKLNKRIKSVFKLTILANLLYLAWDILVLFFNNQSIHNYFNSLISQETIFEFLIINESPFSGHLWYLSAYLYVLIIFYFILRLKLIRASFKMVPLLLLLSLAFGQYSVLIFGYDYPTNFSRNFLFTGLPFFLLGIYIRKYSEKRAIKINNFSLLLGILSLSLTTLIEASFLNNSPYSALGDLYFSTPLLVSLIFIYAIKNPNLFKNSWIARKGSKLTLYIYIAHPIVISFYGMALDGYENELVDIYNLTAPIVVFLTSILISNIYLKAKVWIDDYVVREPITSN